MAWLAVSTAGQIVVILLLTFAVISLARQIGVLHERTAPASLERKTTTLNVGEVFPGMDVQTLAGEQISLGGTQARWLALLFVAADCPICRSVLPAYMDCLDRAGNIRGLWVGDGMGLATFERYAQENGLEPHAFVVSQELGLLLGIRALPAIAVFDNNSRILAQQVVNGPRQLGRVFDQLAIPSGENTT